MQTPEGSRSWFAATEERWEWSNWISTMADPPWLLAPVLLLAAVIGSFQLVFEREDYSA